MGPYSFTLYGILLATSTNIGQIVDAFGFSGTISINRLSRRRNTLTSANPTIYSKTQAISNANGEGSGRVLLRDHCHQYRIFHEEILSPCRLPRSW